MAGFVKLHSDILRSTIWFARPDRDIFITALLLAELREFPDTAQLCVDSLDETGWTVPAGWYGFVPASGPGIVNQAGVALTEGMTALARMGEPEPESRSQAFGGRRLVRIDGGYLILNYTKYRDKDSTGAQRAARYRAKKQAAIASRLITSSHGDVTVTHGVTGRDVTHAEEYADEDGDQIERAPRASRRRPSASKGWRTVPEDWNPSPDSLAAAESLGIDVELELQKFRAHRFKTAKQKPDLCWETWYRSDYATKRKPGQSSQQPEVQQRIIYAR